MLLGTALGPLAPPPAGAVAAPDRLVVHGRAAAPSTTVLALSPPAPAYGRTVRATATVTSPAGPAQGDVVFSVDGARFPANLTGGGQASILLPRLGAGPHDVVAAYVPQFPDRQDASSSAPTTLVVAPVRTSLDVRVSGARPRAVARVHLGASGDFGTVPTGEVRLRLFRGAPPPRVARTLVLDAAGRSVVRLGRLRPGRYRLVVHYRGDTQHQRASQTLRFGVPGRA